MTDSSLNALDNIEQSEHHGNAETIKENKFSQIKYHLKK